MIKDIFIILKTLHLKQPFKISYEEVTKASVIILKLTDSQGNVGLGSAAPDEEVTGEKIDQALYFLQKRLVPKFFSYPIFNYLKYHQKIQREFSQYPSLQNAIEEAIINLYLKQRNISPSKFFGRLRQSCPIMVTIGIKNIKNTLKEVEEKLSLGFKIIKLKIGLNVNSDIKKIKAIRQIIPKDRQLILDANQGYTLKEAEKFLKAVSRLDITLIEQPVAAKDFNGLKLLHQLSKIPIVADESVVSYNDALFLLKNDYVSGINIKLMKCGGPLNFLKIFNIAKKYKKIIMIGCMYESNISITTGVALALGLALDYVDLDSGHLDFTDDPTSGGAKVVNGKIKLGEPMKLTI